MPELPIISGKEAIKIFGSMGFKLVRQKGSHAVLRKGTKVVLFPFTMNLLLAPYEVQLNKPVLLLKNL